jgi:CRP-like cAMP-binding protein
MQIKRRVRGIVSHVPSHENVSAAQRLLMIDEAVPKFRPDPFPCAGTREEIGSYLGLKLETVSRLFSRFQDDGLIEVQQKHVRILDSDSLEALLAAKN